MNVFNLREALVMEYGDYVAGFVRIRDDTIRTAYEDEVRKGLLWPEPLIQFNPNFERGDTIPRLVTQKALHKGCSDIFRARKTAESTGVEMTLHKHQLEAIQAAQRRESYVLTTGTGSGKSLSYIVPIIDHVLRQGSGRGIQAIIVYPMNALANSQMGELEKFLGFHNGGNTVTYARYTGQEEDEARQAILDHPPDILLTNYVMLELILTRVDEKPLIQAAKGLSFLVLDELHTYRGRQGADVALLVRRLREALTAPDMLCVGTSATMASGADDPRPVVARVASKLFGSPVAPSNVILESLAPATKPLGPTSRQDLTAGLKAPTATDATPDEFVKHALSRWIEHELAIEWSAHLDRFVRRKPRPLRGPESASELLATSTGTSPDVAAQALASHLLAGYTIYDQAGANLPFAFRLHQFLSRGGTPYASLEAPPARVVALEDKTYAPGSNRQKRLFPVVFCRECGEEYYPVRIHEAATGRRLEPRDLLDMSEVDGSRAGYLHISSDPAIQWPRDRDAWVNAVPDDWLKIDKKGNSTIAPHLKKQLPEPITVDLQGHIAAGSEATLIPGKFNFCFRCGVSHSRRARKEGHKLIGLEAEARSTATTILTHAAVRWLRADGTLDATAQKLLSFTDNRQDASLQAGHFNDFVQVGTIRSGLVSALAAVPDGLDYQTLGPKILDALALPLETYANLPEGALRSARQKAELAMQHLLEYRLYQDLRRGYRITSPNLEQCDLLRVTYPELSELAQEDEYWAKRDGRIAQLGPKRREDVLRTLLDHLRRNLALDVPAFDQTGFDTLRKESDQFLKDPWGLDEAERAEGQTWAYANAGNRDFGVIVVGPRGSFGQYLGRQISNPAAGQATREDKEHAIQALFEGLADAGILRMEPDEDDRPMYILRPSALRWQSGEGRRAPIDPLATPKGATGTDIGVNEFFVRHYRDSSRHILVQGAAHTAQVPSEVRQEREERFREGALPLLFCSPTMELGVDIKDLNVVNLRNVPPTPANYSQRSGRAGRSGQPALVFTYCSRFSPHDQYFFQRPAEMVAGIVAPPALDLANLDLLRSHAHAVWLHHSNKDLHSSIADLVDLSRVDAGLPLQESMKGALDDPGARRRAVASLRAILAPLESELAGMPWWRPDWPETVIAAVTASFEQALERWRYLYHAAYTQSDIQHRRTIAGASEGERKRADALRREAVAQLALLQNTSNRFDADFYSYRYLASEGFLPGYNFPRLPLTAFLPARSRKRGDDEFLSRPRLIAISEFGPRTVIYHEGSTYQITRAQVPIDPNGEDGVLLQSAKVCNSCGYLHNLSGDANPDICDNCQEDLPPKTDRLFRLQAVWTKRRNRITSDEEERRRMGFEVQTTIRFQSTGNGVDALNGTAKVDGATLATLRYGDRAELWRLNLGERRRRNKADQGFIIDAISGDWGKTTGDEEDEDPVNKPVKVIPFVTDNTNCLLVTPDAASVRRLTAGHDLAPEAAWNAFMATLQAALKLAIQVVYQVEDREIAVEALPHDKRRNVVMLYESSQGGAGVLRRVLEDPTALQTVARKALHLLHFDAETGGDLRRTGHMREDCEASCYNCLKSYFNQRDHRILDRQLVAPYLLALAKTSLAAWPGHASRDDHLEALLRRCRSQLEKDFITRLAEGGYRLPDHSNHRLEGLFVEPDFYYEGARAAVFIDGAPHQYRDVAQRDERNTALLTQSAYQVIRLKVDANGRPNWDQWLAEVRRHPDVFGGPA